MDDNTLTLAHQAGIVPGRPVTAAQLAELADLVRADERERIKAEPVQEPVAVVGTQVDVRRDQRIELEYVYTAPPQSKPLTEEETDRLMQSIGLRHQPPATVADRLARHGIPMPGDDST